MHILVLGAGALGSILAAYLTRAGETVTVLARGARASYLRASGLRPCGVVEFTVPCTVVTDPRPVQEVDALVMAVKAYDTVSALAGLHHLRVQSVFSVQNGLLKNEQLASTFGAQKTIGVACLFAGEVLASGAVRYTLERELYLGPLPGQDATPAQTLAHTLRHAGLQAVYSAHIQTLERRTRCHRISHQEAPWECGLTSHKPTRSRTAAIRHAPFWNAVSRSLRRKKTASAPL